MSAAETALAPVLDVSVEVTAELGRCTMRIRDVLDLSAGAVVALDRAAGTPIDLLVNARPVARGHLIAVDDRYGFQVLEIIAPSQGPPAGEATLRPDPQP